MSFASNTRAEIARELCDDEHICCARAELAAALICSDGITYRFGSEPKYALTITASEAASVRHYFQLLKRHFNVVAQIRTIRSNSLKRNTRYQLLIPEEDGRMLMEETGLYDPEGLFGIAQVPKEGITDRECCRAAFVKSAFMISGGIANPEKEYHAEIDVPTEVFADRVIKNLTFYEIRPKKACRKSKYVIYLKSSDGVTDLLSLIGANQAVLTYYNVRAKKDVGNQVNRQMNCDASNIKRVMDTALLQMEDIRYIDKTIGLDKLPEALREIAEIRLNNSATSLTGLGEMLKKPIGKSGVNARLKKISAIAEKLRNGEEAGI